MSGTLALASAIALLDRESLARLVRLRPVQAPATVFDPIGLAAQLLRPESISRALTHLDRDSLALLASHRFDEAPDRAAALAALGLVGAESANSAAPVALPEVDEALAAELGAAGVAELASGAAGAAADSPAGSGSGAAGAEAADDSNAGAASARSAGAAASSAWFTPALTATAEVAECLRQIAREPLRLNRSGVVGVVAVRELGERAAISAEAAGRALRLASGAGLTHAAGGRLVLAAAADRWLGLTHPERWLDLATSTLERTPRELLETLRAAPNAGSLGAAGAGLAHRYPLLPEPERAAAAQLVTDAEMLGCTAAGELTDVSARLLAGNAVAAAEVAALLPAATPGVYLQPDLTVLAPGPLSPSDERALSDLTVPEQIGPASMRRVTDAALNTAFERGITPADARATFERLSLTGIPQPLDYMLTTISERQGRILVFEHEGFEGRTRIRVADAQLASTAMVDRQLQHLGLQRGTIAGALADAPVLLYSRLRSDHVLMALNEARYHAAAGVSVRESVADTEDTSAGASVLGVSAPGAATPGASASGAEAPAAATAAGTAAPARQEPPVTSVIDAVVERVFLAARTEPESADFTRRLELAIRDKSAVRVTAEARGQQHSFTLVPVALTDGRLRATDAVAGVERSFPVSMIVAVEEP